MVVVGCDLFALCGQDRFTRIKREFEWRRDLLYFLCLSHVACATSPDRPLCRPRGSEVAIARLCFPLTKSLSDSLLSAKQDNEGIFAHSRRPSSRSRAVTIALPNRPPQATQA